MNNHNALLSLKIIMHNLTESQDITYNNLQTVTGALKSIRNCLSVSLATQGSSDLL